MLKGIESMKKMMNGLGIVRSSSLLGVTQNFLPLQSKAVQGSGLDTKGKNNMKKLMITAAAAFCATVALSVESQIVGYETSGLVSGKSNMTGVMFVGVDGGDLDLNKDFQIANLTGGDDETESDLVQVWNAADGKYTTFYYYQEVDCEEDWGWYVTTGKAQPIFPAGTAFWYKAKGDKFDKSITISGAIETDADITFPVVGGKSNMIVNPYPTLIDLNDAETVEFVGLTGGDDETESDLVQVWNAADGKYTTFYYYQEVDCEEDWGWYVTTGKAQPQVASGVGFWYKAKVGEGKAIKFKNPIK